MTFQRDFILRIIEDFFRFLAVILKLKSEKQYQQAFDAIDEAGEKLLHLDIKLLESEDYDISQATEAFGLNSDQTEILARLLMIKADIQLEMGNRITALRLYEKAKYLLEWLQSTSKNFSIERGNLLLDIYRNLNTLKG